MARMVKRLSNLEIDEVSLVDRPANQHGLVTIAKNDQEEPMDELYDLEGNPVDTDQLEPGDHVYTADGAEYVYTETDDDGAEQYEDERELASVGKAVAFGPLKQGERALGRDVGDKTAPAWNWARRNKRALGAGAGVAGVGAGAGYAGGRVGKSFGDQVLEELSKALNEPERDAVLSKALGQVEEVAKRNAELEGAVAFLLEDRELGDFVELAKSYDGLPAETDELAGVLQRAAHALSPEDMQVLDRVFTGASEVGKAFFEEVGYGGMIENDPLAQVYALADQAVAKNAELGLTAEQATSAIFDANPGAYDAYLADNR